MTAIATLIALASGEPVDGSLLHCCRFSGLGGEAYGADAIFESFRSNPVVMTAESECIETPGNLAMFMGDTALIADVYAGGIARLWRIGPGTLATTEPRIDVPFDPCLTQAANDLGFAASDHPRLTPEAGARVVAIGHSVVRTPAMGVAASRAFVVRGFGDGDYGAALFTVHHLGGDRFRTAGFVNVAALWRGDTLYIVRDSAGEAALSAAIWTPVVLETAEPSPHDLDMQ